MAGKAPGANVASAAASPAQAPAQQHQRWREDDGSPQLPDAGDFDAVTPGINLSTYVARPSSRVPHSPRDILSRSHHQHPQRGDSDDAPPSYFSRADPTIRRPNGPLPLRRTTTAAMASGRRESLSDIQRANPDLALSGNIISATFNIPHAFSYSKGGDWVRPSAQTRGRDRDRQTDRQMLTLAGPEPPSRPVRPLRLVCLPRLRRLALAPHRRRLDRRDRLP